MPVYPEISYQVMMLGVWFVQQFRFEQFGQHDATRGLGDDYLSCRSMLRRALCFDRLYASTGSMLRQALCFDRLYASTSSA
ncbi:hypothetical protein WG906_00990 [Pedobacter sp. P351]|uniref:hypothetical protein n=1 Tax=Pedobacter superstes TaxID=3133441 RepID=UPI0030B50144